MLEKQLEPFQRLWACGSAADRLVDLVAPCFGSGEGVGVVQLGGDLVGGAVADAAVGPCLDELHFVGTGRVGKSDGGESLKELAG